jgi:hypothetical protein
MGVATTKIPYLLNTAIEISTGEVDEEACISYSCPP